MSERWFYRMLGHDFGPISFDELKALVDSETISPDDEIRHENSAEWVKFASVGEAKSPSVRSPSASATPDESSTWDSSSADEWYCRFQGQELGPLLFDELVDYTHRGQLTADDEVRFGVNGKWRRVGSMGRLVAVLPYQDERRDFSTAATASAVSVPPASPKLPAEAKAAIQQAPIPASPASSTTVAPAAAPSAPIVAPTAVASKPAIVDPKPAAVEVQTTAQPANQPESVEAIRISNLERELIRAEAAHEATSQAARKLVVLTLSPHSEGTWWGAIDGVEHGPMGFTDLVERAMTGALKPSDFVRNNIFAPYMPASNLPGLFAAVSMVDQTQEALRRAQRLAGPIVTNAPPATAEKPVVAPTTVSVVPEIKPPAPAPAAPETTAKPSISEDRPTSGSSYNSSFSNPASSGSAPGRTPSRTPVSKRRSSTSSPLSIALGLLQTRAGLGAVAALVVALLGWTYVANRNNTDIKRYKTLKRLLDDVRAKRFVKSTDVEEIKKRAAKLSAELAPALKKEGNYPLKKALLAAVGDDVPQMMEQDLSVESTQEKEFVKRLNEAKKILGLK